ncbi:MAG: cytochrome c biogenesis protein, partial [Actinomycetes bacterium]
MPVDTVLASYGDLAYGTALVLYLFTMVLHAVEYAGGQVRSATAQPATATERAATERAATAQGVVDGGGPVATLAPPRDSRSRSERIGRAAVALTGLAVVVHGCSLALRGAAVGRVPWGNMYEFTSAVCFVAMLAWLVVLSRQRSSAPTLRRLAVFVLLPVVVLLFLAGTVLYADAAPLIPALNSYWIMIHVSAAITSTGILLVSGVASVLYLVREGGGQTPARLPSGALLDRVAYRTAVVAFPIWTFALITGAIWA